MLSIPPDTDPDQNPGNLKKLTRKICHYPLNQYCGSETIISDPDLDPYPTWRVSSNPDPALRVISDQNPCL